MLMCSLLRSGDRLASVSVRIAIVARTMPPARRPSRNHFGGCRATRAFTISMVGVITARCTTTDITKMSRTSR